MASVSQETTALSVLLQGWATTNGYIVALHDAIPKDTPPLSPTRNREVERDLTDRFKSTLQQHHPDLFYGLSDYDIRVTVMWTGEQYVVLPYLERKQK